MSERDTHDAQHTWPSNLVHGHFAGMRRSVDSDYWFLRRSGRYCHDAGYLLFCSADEICHPGGMAPGMASIIASVMPRVGDRMSSGEEDCRRL